MPKKSLALFFLLLVIAGGPIACSGPDVESTPRPAQRATSTTSPSSYKLNGEEEASYVADARGIMSIYTKAFQSILDLGRSVSAQPSLIMDDSWQNQMASAFAQVKMANEAARKLNPPLRFQAAHSHLIDATYHYDKGVDLYAESIDKIDPSLLQEALREFALGNDAMNQATSALK